LAAKIKLQKWKLIGHTMRKDNSTITKQGLKWNPQGQRRRGRPKRRWRRVMQDVARTVGKTWREVKAIAGNKSPLVLLRGGPMLRN
jgi:hypothetical protein